jgi:hypothetical protein
MNLIKFFCVAAIKVCEKLGREFHITGTGGDTDVYLIRYYVVQSKWFNIFIHRFMRSDRDDMHDHPWNFGTYIVQGSYREEVPCPHHPDSNSDHINVNTRSITYRRWATRKAEQLHRVKIDRTYTLAEKEQAPLTLCITGRTRRDWGFVKNGQWIFWKTYLGLPENTPSRG